jgi:4-amino-4-deoxy-L-arabinose transferase-like glycosyltransferase
MSSVRLVTGLTVSVVALFSAWLLFRDLGADSLRGDEAMYAEVVLDSRTDGRWVPPVLRGEPFVNKPPGGLLALAAGFAVLGDGETAARVPAAVAGVALAILIATWGAARLGPFAGAFAATLFVTAPVALGRHALRGGTFDAAVALLVTVAVLAHLESLRPGRERWFRLTPGLAAVATLFKSMAGPALIAGAVLATEVAGSCGSRGVRAGLLGGLRRAVAVFGAGIAVLASLTAAAAAGGVDDAFDRMVVWDLLRRNLERVHPSHVGPWWFYLDRMTKDFGPLLILLLVPPAALVVRRRHPGDSAGPDRAASIGLALLAATGSVLLLLSISASKLRWYGLQLVPLTSLAVAAGACQLVRGRSRTVRGALVAALAVALAVRIEWAVRRTDTPPRRTLLDRAEAAVRSIPGARLVAAPGLDLFATVGHDDYAWDEAASNAFYLRLAREPSVPHSGGRAPCEVLLAPATAAADARVHRLGLPAGEGPFELIDGCGGEVVAALGAESQTSDNR